MTYPSRLFLHYPVVGYDTATLRLRAADMCHDDVHVCCHSRMPDELLAPIEDIPTVDNTVCLPKVVRTLTRVCPTPLHSC